jgi:hypothetical protein
LLGLEETPADQLIDFAVKDLDRDAAKSASAALAMKPHSPRSARLLRFGNRRLGAQPFE